MSCGGTVGEGILNCKENELNKDLEHLVQECKCKHTYATGHDFITIALYIQVFLGM